MSNESGSSQLPAELRTRKKRSLPVVRHLWPKEYRKTKIALAVGGGLLASVWLAPLWAVGAGAATLVALDKIDE